MLVMEEEIAKLHGLDYLHFPIQDYNIPTDMSNTLSTTNLLVEKVERGESIFIHCKGGLGRSSLMTSLLLLSCGYEPGRAFTDIGNARGETVPETLQQKQWVEGVWKAHFAG